MWNGDAFVARSWGELLDFAKGKCDATVVEAGNLVLRCMALKGPQVLARYDMARFFSPIHRPRDPRDVKEALQLQLGLMDSSTIQTRYYEQSMQRLAPTLTWPSKPAA